uniref:Uncharacterized protein n=1 Tax=Spermophilus dauricus TaxID=99837 RepID=A0A8C9NYE1_SPEDA
SPSLKAVGTVCASAACGSRSRHLDAFARGAGLDNGNFLDNDQWLSTVSQYDRDKYWNRFRDVSTAAARSCGAGEGSLGEEGSGAWWEGCQVQTSHGGRQWVRFA